jgi:hypothetical protein
VKDVIMKTKVRVANILVGLSLSLGLGLVEGSSVQGAGEGSEGGPFGPSKSHKNINAAIAAAIEEARLSAIEEIQKEFDVNYKFGSTDAQLIKNAINLSSGLDHGV